MSPEPEPYREDDEEEEYAPQSIFAAGWFRAVLVLTVLAIVVVVSLPYLLNWFEPKPTLPQPAQRATAPQVAEPKAAEPRAAAETKLPEAKGGPKAVAEKPSGDKGSTPAKASAEKPALPAAAKPAERAAKAEPKAVAALPSAESKAAAPAPAGKPAPAAGRGSYWLQLGLFKDRANAESLAKAVREQGFAVEVTQIAKSNGSLPPGTYHLVRAGGFPDRATAGKAREALGAKGHQAFVTKSTAP